ncbi:MAG: hypothetical protein IKQ97_10880 [Eubacterium sp.]|nr:hypothetical protein [Eubacterium sp.]
MNKNDIVGRTDGSCPPDRDFRNNAGCFLHVEDPLVRRLSLQGKIGLERESLRITTDGHMAHTPDYFSSEKNIVRDFCENQTEINTPPCDSVNDVMESLAASHEIIVRTLKEADPEEYLWPHSNPPYIVNEDDIPIAQYTDTEVHKQRYREYLSERYGRYKMTFSGIHFNYSPGEALLQANHEAFYPNMTFSAYRDAFYMSLGAKSQAYNWLIVALTAASPLLDSSYVEKGVYGRDVFNGMGSTRCSELGYWNYFTPILDYSHISNYAESILSYIERGLIRSAAELYFPVRIKSFHEYSPCSLCEEGVSHIELRMIDLNPLTPYGIDERDVAFIKLYLIWLSSLPSVKMEAGEQVIAIQNTKNAARYDLKTVNILMPDGRSLKATAAAEEVLGEMKKFFENLNADETSGPVFPDEGGSDEPSMISEILDYQIKKIEVPETRYAWRIREEYGDGFVEKTLEKLKKT